jgi:hypothetical protein
LCLLALLVACAGSAAAATSPYYRVGVDEPSVDCNTSAVCGSGTCDITHRVCVCDSAYATFECAPGEACCYGRVNQAMVWWLDFTFGYLGVAEFILGLTTIAATKLVFGFLLPLGVGILVCCCACCCGGGDDSKKAGGALVGCSACLAVTIGFAWWIASLVLLAQSGVVDGVELVDGNGVAVNFNFQMRG